MLPLSLVRPSSAGPQRIELRRALAWVRPANTSSRSLLERRALVVWMGIVAAVAVTIALVHVWLRLQVVNVGYRLSAARDAIARLQQEEHELTLEVATLDAPARLEDLARERLGMQRAERGQEAVLR
jgi:cell division protein FtsL